MASWVMAGAVRLGSVGWESELAALVSSELLGCISGEGTSTAGDSAVDACEASLDGSSLEGSGRILTEAIAFLSRLRWRDSIS